MQKTVSRGLKVKVCSGFDGAEAAKLSMATAIVKMTMTIRIYNDLNKHYALAARAFCNFRCLECAPYGGQFQPAVLTGCWAWRSSYCAGLR